MSRILEITASSLMLLAASSQPANAYWHDHDEDHHWNHHNEQRVVYVTPETYYATPAPQVAYYPQPATYYQQQVVNTSVIHCYHSASPLAGLIGGGTGGLIGSQVGKGVGRTAAIISGALLGGAIGMSVNVEHCNTETVAQPVPINWQTHVVQPSYSITPVSEFNSNGRYCREYQAVAQIGGHTHETYGTACMQPDGSWEIIN